MPKRTVTVTVTVSKPSGKYYTTETWNMPEDAIGPYDMCKAPEFQGWKNWNILIDEQEPWGYPHLFLAEPKDA